MTDYLRRISSNMKIHLPIINWTEDNTYQITDTIIKLQNLLVKINEFPSAVGQFYNDLSQGLLFMCQRYQYILDDLKEKTDKIQATIKTYEYQKEKETHRLSKELQQKQQIIKILTKKMMKLQQLITESETNRSIEKRTRRNTNQMIPIVEQNSFRKSESTRVQQIKTRSNIIKQRYFKYRKQNELLKNKINNLSKTQLMDLKSTSRYLTCRDQNNNTMNISTTIGSINQTSENRLKRNSVIEQNVTKQKQIINEQQEQNRKSSKSYREDVQEALTTFLFTLRSC